jgi:N-acetyl-D-muramate 6-phosphate phosphatase
MSRPAAVLFDLDGTLVDSAPDLGGAANDMLAARGLPPLPLAALRPHGGSGARGMVGAAFGLGPYDAGYTELRDEFLQVYEARLLRHTTLFDEVEALVEGLTAARVPFGIVTNKALRLATPLAQALRLVPPAAVLVGGDSTPHTKPHPAPLWAACQALGVAAADCVYIGDDPRDMRAAAAAGMPGWAAAWGYLGVAEPLHAWGAAATLDSPAGVLKRLGLA